MPDATSNFLNLDNVTQALINVNGAGGGPSILPKQHGEFRIPFVKNLRMGPVQSYYGGTQFTLLWDEPDNTTNVSHYNVFVTGALANNQSPLGPFSAERSPQTCRIVTSTAALLTFYVQTQLNNGNVSALGRSPSCTGISVDPNPGNPAKVISPPYTVIASDTALKVVVFGNISLDRSTSYQGHQIVLQNASSGIARLIPLGGDFINGTLANYDVPPGATVTIITTATGWSVS
jgi:hypothetical protein